MGGSLSNPVNYRSERIHKIKFKNEHGNKTCETRGIKCKDYECLLECTNLKDDFIEYKYLCCNENYNKNFDENQKKLLFNYITIF